jgi:hypothetical protein
MKNTCCIVLLLLAGCSAPTPPQNRPPVSAPVLPPAPPRVLVLPPMPGTTNAGPVFRAASAPTVREATFRAASFSAFTNRNTNIVRKPLPPIRRLKSINLSTTNGSYRIEHSAKIDDQNWVPFIFVGGWPGVSIIEQSGSPYGFYRAVPSSNPSNAPSIFP